MFKAISVCKNGDPYSSRVLVLQEGFTLDEFKQLSTAKLKINAIKIYDNSGKEISGVDELTDNGTFYISQGENFTQPTNNRSTFTLTPSPVAAKPTTTSTTTSTATTTPTTTSSTSTTTTTPTASLSTSNQISTNNTSFSNNNNLSPKPSAPKNAVGQNNFVVRPISVFGKGGNDTQPARSIRQLPQTPQITKANTNTNVNINTNDKYSTSAPNLLNLNDQNQPSLADMVNDIQSSITPINTSQQQQQNTEFQNGLEYENDNHDSDYAENHDENIAAEEEEGEEEDDDDDDDEGDHVQEDGYEEVIQSLNNASVLSSPTISSGITFEEFTKIYDLDEFAGSDGELDGAGKRSRPISQWKASRMATKGTTRLTLLGRKDSVKSGFFSNTSISLNDQKGSIITIKLPEEKVIRKLPIFPSTTAADVIITICKKTKVENPETYALISPNNQELAPDQKLYFLPFDSSQEYLYKRVRTRLEIMIITGMGESVYEISMPNDCKVKEIREKICKTQWGGRFASTHKLFLPHKGTKKSGILLDEDRTITSYRLSAGDKLLFANEQEMGLPNLTENGDQKIIIVVHSSEHNVSKTIAMNSNATVNQLFEQIIKRHPVANPRDYGLFLPSKIINVNPDKVDKKPAGSGTPLSYSTKLGKIPITAPPLQLVLQQTPKGTYANKVFGVDPSTLKLVWDHGYKVPKILVTLRKNISQNNGYSSEGIFRLAGHERRMEELTNDLNNSRPINDDNVHNFSTLLKRFFKELPERLFGKITDELLDEDEENLLKAGDRISDLYKSMLLWLLDLLADTVSHEMINKMDTKNLAIVWGPGLVGSSVVESNPLATLSLTQLGTNLVYMSLNYFCLHNRTLPIKMPPKQEAASSAGTKYSGVGGVPAGRGKGRGRGAPLNTGTKPVSMGDLATAAAGASKARQQQSNDALGSLTFAKGGVQLPPPRAKPPVRTPLNSNNH
eukprot:TRINITY_DN3108_c0_g6_i1.p1 TRINITY_DN3108_c0_g6~~TRINITY_DN3108_c0_g6_i1.p1  ORF type:complete len:960 (-),score=465.42 TRINITY_DN3108_c0_g6_i1:87-2966(-)